jgi:hypothetical protein
MLTALALAALTAGQYASPQQGQQYGAPPPTYSAPITYAIPQTYAAPQVVTLGAGQVIPPGPIGICLGRLGQRLERHSWPRVQPMAAQPVSPPMLQTIYVQLVQAQPQYQTYAMPQYAPPPPPTMYGAPPPPPTMYGAPPPPKGQPQAQPQAYGSPQGGQYNAPAPPVPPR